MHDTRVYDLGMDARGKRRIRIEVRAGEKLIDCYLWGAR